MFRRLSDKLKLPTLEEEVLEHWKKYKVFEQTLQRPHAPDFTFYEGPPTANGKPGIHHVFSRTIKDLVCRYKTMRGYQVHRKAGWDTHGLPVEIEVERKLGIKQKEEIEEYGIDRFNTECRKSVFEYKDVWESLTTRMGYWVDMDSPYVTCENEYIESVWWALDSFFKNGLIYQDFKIQLYCPRCGTPLSSHEVSLGYRDVDDPSIYVKARLTGEENTFFLVWTTTPWTLISNVALAVGPDIEYVKVREGDEYLILAKERLSVLGDDADVVDSFNGTALIGKEYERWFDFFPVEEKAWYVVAASFVTTTDGSGIVHLAPAYGEDDYQASKAHNLPMIQAVDQGGAFRPEAPTVRRPVLQTGRPGNHPRPQTPRALAFQRDLSPQLSTLLALRNSADLLRTTILVHPNHGVCPADDRTESDYRLASTGSRPRSVRKLAGGKQRLGHLAKSVLGYTYSDMGV